jgi:murein DD-endopeptidase MepM/ murein hydrolase activator NlpD
MCHIKRGLIFFYEKRIIIGIALLFALFAFVEYKRKDTIPEPAVSGATTPLKEDSLVEYGLSHHHFKVVKSEFKKNESLGAILFNYHISYSQIDELAKKASKIFNFKNFSFGKPYTIFCSKDSVEKAQCFVYETSPTEYVFVDFRDGINVYKKEKESERCIETVSGVIEGSLFETLDKLKLSSSLAVKLADIYACTIDFYKIKKDDNFNIVYEQIYIEGKAVDAGRILAAEFNHNNESFYAIYYDGENNGKGNYYDEKGNGMKKAFLKAPLKFSRISSPYSLKRFHPVQKINKPHLGTDYAAPSGTPIMSVADGTILEAKYGSANGNYVKIKHNQTYTTQYLHMSKIAKGMRSGEKVKQGEVIGYVGSTGLATGPHLCYRFWKNGKQVNPLKEKLPMSQPIDSRYRNEFNIIKDEMMLKLKKENNNVLPNT